MHTNSYFAKHKLAQSKQSRLKLNKDPTLNPLPPAPLQLSDKKIQQIALQKQKSLHHQHMHIPQQQLKSQQEKVYQQYKRIKDKYQQQLKQLNIQMQRIKKQSQGQIKKIKHAENNLQAKKKELKVIKTRYQEMRSNYEKEEVEELSMDVIGKLERQLAEMEESNRKKIQELKKEEEQAKLQNQKLQEKYQLLQVQYKKALEFDQTQFQSQKKKLQYQQKKLKQQLANLQNEGDRLRKQIQKIQQMKPVSSDVHKKYLDLFEKIFISQQLAKAQKIMQMKQEEKKQNIQYTRRKEMLKEKQKQMQQRQARVAEKNKQVDKLTAEIRQKSTLLLTKYQQDAEKHSRR